MSAKILGFVFNVASQTEFSGTPTIKNVISSFDLSGELLSTPRLEGESLQSYKQRLMDVSVHPGGPEYFGVINNLTRDFGFLRELAFTINLVLDIDGNPIARNPRVDILVNKVVLYSDWRTDGTAVVDREIKIYQPSDEGYFLSDLISAINQSIYFVATIHTGVRENLHSTNLVRDTSDVFISLDPIRASSRTKLSIGYIVEDSVSFTETKVFHTLSSTPSQAGEYNLDRTTGTLYPYSSPSGDFGCSYHAASFPMQVDYSPIKVYTLNDDNFQFELFTHETLDSGQEANGLPNTEGSEIMHQLYKETEVFWGK